MKKILIFCIISSITIMSFASIQTAWEQNFGGVNSDAANSICEAPDGGFLIGGYTNSLGNNSDIFLIKTDVSGNQEWTQSYGGSGWESAKDVCVSNNNDGFVITGYSTENGDFDAFCMKVDLSGNQIWYITIGGSEFDTAESICQTTDGSYLICGYTSSYGLGEDDIYVVKIAENGTVLWENTFGCTKSDTGHCIMQTSEDNYLICGSTGLYDIPVPNSTGRNREIYLIKIDGSGNTIVENTYWTMGTHQNDYDVGFDVCETSDGGFCVVGHTSQHLNELMDVALVKVDSQLNELWKTNLELAGFYDFGYSIQEDVNSDNLFLCGSSKYANVRYSDMFLMILDSAGNEIENVLIGGNGSECGNSLLQKADGSILIAGYNSSAGAGNNDVWLLELVNLSAEFDADQKSGHAPLQIQFEDQSSGMIENWAWDFDNDGIIDSNEQNPLWTYSDPGFYDVKLTISFSGVEDLMLKEEYIRVFDGESSLGFDGSSYAECPANPNLNITSTFTCEAWVLPETYGATQTIGFGRIFDKGKFSLYLIGEILIYNNHSILFEFENEAGETFHCYTPINSFELLDIWQHIAVTYDGAGDIKIYINGDEQEITSENPPSGNIANNELSPFTIGNSLNHSQGTVGKIDEFRIWDIVCSEEQITNNMLYHLSGSEAGLIASWEMNEGNGLLLSDKTGNNNNAFIYDAIWEQGVDLTYLSVEPDIIEEFSKTKLFGAYPNPFNPATTIKFQLLEKENVRLEIFNLKGQKVKTLINEAVNAGNHNVVWDGKDNIGKPVSSGIYFYKMNSGTFSSTRKMILMK